MRMRDRRGPLTAMILLAAYLAIVCWAVAFAGRQLGLIAPLPASGLMNAVVVVGFIGLVWRALMRFAFTTALYGRAEGVRALVRLPIANVIAIVAARRALAAYVRTLRGQRAIWEKTHHDRHPFVPGMSEAT